jgi:outer membrane receptor protein involved in Fe transport
MNKLVIFVRKSHRWNVDCLCLYQVQSRENQVRSRQKDGGNRMKSWFSVLVCLFLMAVFGAMLASPGYGQTSNGAIAGVITDKSGSAVPDAFVIVTSDDRGGEPRQVSTDASGSFRAEALTPGKYTVSVKKNGFSDLKISGIDVRASLTVTTNGVLEVAGQNTTVLVEATNAQQLQTQSGDLSASLGSTDVHELPINGLNPIALVLTEPGVQDGNGRGLSNGMNFSVNGSRPRANNFLIDGQDNNDNSIAGQAFQPTNLEAIGEVTILSNSYSAEFGRGGGSVTNVIYKGGTNDFHGSAWELATNSALASAAHENLLAGCEQDGSCHPVSVENTFGFAFGGPIKHNKLFVFGSSQWDRTRSTNNGGTIFAPTATGLTELQALEPNPNVAYLIAAYGGLTASDTANILKLVPIGSATVGGVDRGTIQFGSIQRSGIGEISNDRQWDVRLDYNATDKDLLTARYYRDDFSLSPDLFNFPNQLQPFDSLQGGPSQSVAVMWTHTISSKALNELRASYTNIGFIFGPTAATTANPLSQDPTVSIANISGGGATFPSLGFPSNLPQGRAHKSFQYQDVFTYTIGRHTLRLGADVNHLSVVDSIPFNSRGTIAYTSGRGSDANNCGLAAGTPNDVPGGCTALANFIDNFTGSGGAVSKVFGSPVLQPFVTTFAPYAEDTYKVKENLTFTLGLRYEYSGTPENVLLFPAVQPGLGFGMVGGAFPSEFSAKQQPDRNNFAPRIGFAYTPRFGGRFLGDGKTVIRGGFGMFYDSLFTNILDNTGGTSPNAVGGTLTGAPTNNGGRGLANASGLLNSVTSTLNPLATVDSIPSNLVNPKTLQWNLNIQRELPGNFIFTAAYVGTRGEHLYVNQQYNPGVTGVRLVPTQGSVLVRTNGADSIYHGGQFSLERQFSRGLLLRAAYTYSKLIDDGSEVFTLAGALTSTSANPFSQASDRGLSAYDRRNRFVMSYVWEIPYNHGDSLGMKALRAVTGHWQWSGILTIQSGIPGIINTGSDTNQDLNAGDDRPNVANASLPLGDFDRYAPAAAGTLGNVGRNTYIGPGDWFWDTSVSRVFPIRFKKLEHQALTVRGEFYNALNHGNQNLPGLDLAAGPSTTPGDGGFGDLKSTVTGQRQIKIYLKYSF